MEECAAIWQVRYVSEGIRAIARDSVSGVSIRVSKCIYFLEWAGSRTSGRGGKEEEDGGEGGGNGGGGGGGER